MKNKVLILSFLTLISVNLLAQKQYTLPSPDGKIVLTVNTGERLSYAVNHENTVVLAESPIAMTLGNGTMLGQPALVSNAKNNTVDQAIPAAFYKRNKVRDYYNELILSFKGNYKVIFRAYDDGVAYRFETSFSRPFNIVSETADFNFGGDQQAWIPYVNARPGEGDFIDQQFFNSFENTYTVTPLSKM